MTSFFTPNMRLMVSCLNNDPCPVQPQNESGTVQTTESNPEATGPPGEVLSPEIGNWQMAIAKSGCCPVAAKTDPRTAQIFSSAIDACLGERAGQMKIGIACCIRVRRLLSHFVTLKPLPYKRAHYWPYFGLLCGLENWSIIGRIFPQFSLPSRGYKGLSAKYT